MNLGEENVVKSIAFSMCFILIVAIMGWTMPLVVGQDTCPVGGCSGGCPVGTPVGTDCTLDQTKIDALAAFLNGGTSLENFEIKVLDDKGAIQVSYGDTKASTIAKTTLTDFNAAMKGRKLTIDGKTGVATIKIGEKNRNIPLKDLPANLETIKVGKDGKVTYMMKDDGGSVVVDKPGVYMIGTEVKADNEGAKAIKGLALKGVLKDKTKPVGVTLVKGGEISVDNKGVVGYKGEGTKLIVDGGTFESIDKEKTGSVEFMEEDVANFVVKNSRVNTNEYGLSVGEGGVYVGDVAKAPKNMIEKGKERVLSLGKDNKLSGNLAGLDKTNKEELKFLNKGKTELVIDKALVSGDTKIPAGQEATFFKGDKGVEAKVGTASGATASSESGKPNVGTPGRPTLPITPGEQGTKINGSLPPVNPNPNPNPNPEGPGGPGGPGGSDSSSSNWLMWALIIGGAAIAAMLLLGGGDDKKKDEAKDEDDVEDSGETYMGKDNETDITDKVQEEERTPTVTYNPTLQQGGCTYDTTGYHNCPVDSVTNKTDCSKCSSAGTKPLIQSVDDNKISTDTSLTSTESEGSTTTA